jgi:hypothetical protein
MVDRSVSRPQKGTSLVPARLAQQTTAVDIPLIPSLPDPSGRGLMSQLAVTLVKCNALTSK